MAIQLIVNGGTTTTTKKKRRKKEKEIRIKNTKVSYPESKITSQTGKKERKSSRTDVVSISRRFCLSKGGSTYCVRFVERSCTG